MCQRLVQLSFQVDYIITIYSICNNFCILSHKYYSS